MKTTGTWTSMDMPTLDVEGLDFCHHCETECASTVALAICITTACSDDASHGLSWGTNIGVSQKHGIWRYLDHTALTEYL
jgi:hypothetical protein